MEANHGTAYKPLSSTGLQKIVKSNSIHQIFTSAASNYSFENWFAENFQLPLAMIIFWLF